MGHVREVSTPTDTRARVQGDVAADAFSARVLAKARLASESSGIPVVDGLLFSVGPLLTRYHAISSVQESGISTCLAKGGGKEDTG